MITLSAFWFFSFFIRPLIFIYTRNNFISNSIFDARLGQDRQSFVRVMSAILLGCTAFLVPLLIQRRQQLRKNPEPIHFSDQRDYIKLITFCFASGFVSLLIDDSRFRNPFSKSLIPLISMSFLVYIWNRKKLRLTKGNHFLFMLLGCTGTFFLYVAQNNSKGILLTPLLIYIATLPNWRYRQRKIRNLFLGVLISILAIPVFSVLQSYKLGVTGLSEVKSASDSLPWYLSPFVVIADRFDQFARIVDVFFAAPQSLGGFGSWGKYLAKSFEWNPSTGRSDLSFGQQWNQLVTNQSIPGTRLSDVSLAQGMIGEGLIWSGFNSLILECSIFSLIFIWIGKLLDRGPLSNLVAFGLIGNAVIFESGLVSFAATASATVKAFLFVFVLKRVLFTRKVP
jgi:hypothetical protein